MPIIIIIILFYSNFKNNFLSKLPILKKNVEMFIDSKLNNGIKDNKKEEEEESENTDDIFEQLDELDNLNNKESVEKPYKEEVKELKTQNHQTF